MKKPMKTVLDLTDLPGPGAQLLDCLIHTQCATHKQLYELMGYQKASYHHIRELTPRLRELDLLHAEAKWDNSFIRNQRAELIFWITQKTRNLFLPKYPYLPDINHDKREHKAGEQPHRLGITDTYLSFVRFVREHPDEVAFLSRRHEYTLKREPITFPYNGQTGVIRPDLWIELAVRGETYPFWLEFDTGSENEEKIRKKIIGITTAWKEACSLFSVPGFAVVFVVRDDEKPHLSVHRCARILMWAEKHLTALFDSEKLRRAWGSVFLFSAVDPSSMSGTDYFTTQHFRSPFDPTPHALIEP